MHVLRDSKYRCVIASQFIHKIAESLYDLSLPLLVLHLVGSPLAMGSVFALGFVAELIIGLFGGVLIDRYDRKRILQGVAGVQTLLMISLALSGRLQDYQLPVILSVVFVLDACILLFRIADTSILPQLVRRQQLPQAASLLQVALSFGESLGPALSGLIISAFGIFGSLWLNLGSFVVVFALVSLLPSQTVISKATSPPAPFLKSTSEGFQFVFNDPVIRPIFIWKFIVSTALNAGILMLMYFLKEELNLDARDIGFIYASGAVGGILCGLLFSRIQRSVSSGYLLLGSSTLLSALFMTLSLSTHWIQISFVYGTMMFSITAHSRLIVLHLQSSISADYLGRVIGLTQLVTRISGPFAVLAGGWLAKNYSSSAVFLIAALVLAGASVWALVSHLYRMSWSIPDEQKSVA